MPVSIPQIFISWSHNEERQIAELFKKLLLECFNVQVFVSSQDIPCDEDFGNAIRENLKAADYGIVCLTKRTKVEPWIMFEAGVLMGRHDFSKVSFILFDMKFEDMPAPIKTRQALLFEQEDIRKLLTTVRDRLSLQEKNSIHNIIDEQWNQFADSVSSLLSKIPQQTEKESEIKRLSEEVDKLIEENKRISNELAFAKTGKYPFPSGPIVGFHANMEKDFINQYSRKLKIHFNSYDDQDIVNLTWRLIPPGSKDRGKYQKNFPGMQDIFISNSFYNNDNSIQYVISKHSPQGYITHIDSNGNESLSFGRKIYPISILKIVNGEIDSSWRRPFDKKDEEKVKNIYGVVSQKALRP